MRKIELVLHCKRKERRKVNGITPRHKYPNILKMALIRGKGYYAQREIDFIGKLYSQQRNHSYLGHLFPLDFLPLGLGFCGCYYAISVASAYDINGIPIFNIFGVGFPIPCRHAAIVVLNNGRFPRPTTGAKLKIKKGNPLPAQMKLLFANPLSSLLLSLSVVEPPAKLEL